MKTTTEEFNNTLNVKEETITLKKERLSKLQRTILYVLEFKKEEYKFFSGNYHVIKSLVAKELGKTKPLNINGFIVDRNNNSISVSFSRSIKLLSKKRLIKTEYCFEKCKLDYHRISNCPKLKQHKKDCEGKNHNLDICKDCKFQGSELHNIEDNLCWFFIKGERRGIVSKKSKIYNIKILERGSLLINQLK
jgi:hypothetical protein